MALDRAIDRCAGRVSTAADRPHVDAVASFQVRASWRLEQRHRLAPTVRGLAARLFPGTAEGLDTGSPGLACGRMVAVARITPRTKPADGRRRC